MKFESMLAFTIIVFLLVLTPGPAVLSLAGIGGAFGYQAGIKYLVGLVIGYHIVIMAVILLSIYRLCSPLDANSFTNSFCWIPWLSSISYCLFREPNRLYKTEEKAWSHGWRRLAVGKSQSLCGEHSIDEWIFILQ